MFKVCKPVAAQMCTAIENLSVQTASRTLFAPSFFNVDKFKEHSSYIQKKQGADKNSLTKNIEKGMSDGKAKLFTEDLKTLIYLTQNEKEFDFIFSAVKKYYSQGESGVFNFHFGMPLMRCAYNLNLTDKMYEMVMNQENTFMTESDIVGQIVMNKLFEAKRYDDVLKVFQKTLESTLKKTITVEGKGPFMAFTSSQLAFETLLEMNDSNALKLAKELNQTLIDQKIAFNKLSSVAMILLALNHNDYQFAYETFLTLEKKAFGNQLNAAERNLKVILLLKMNKVDEALNEYDHILSLENQRLKFFGETVACFREASQKTTPEVQAKIDEALTKAAGLFTVEPKAFFFREQTMSQADKKKERERNFGASDSNNNRSFDFKQRSNNFDSKPRSNQFDSKPRTNQFDSKPRTNQFDSKARSNQFESKAKSGFTKSQKPSILE